ncbi:HAD family hydrolase [Psychrobacillus sp. FSL W7-1457]|uniref:HAD family hydrolase n=1 Tax=unclassified Psychrobacillus TaxID=2636677 RepID=UPI0030F7457C
MSKLSRDAKVIFLDAGGVLFDTFVKGEQRIINLLLERGYTRSEVVAAIHIANETEKQFITTWEEEKQYYERYYGAIAKYLKNKEVAKELFLFTHYAVNCELFVEVKQVLENLSKNYRLAVISNAMPSMDLVFDRLEIRCYFEAIILSSSVQLEKPNVAIYELALKKLSVCKEESVFIDDKKENIYGSEQAGIKGLYLDRNKQDLEMLLKEYQIWFF